MIFTPLSIPDVIKIEPNVFGDERGFFMETFQSRIFSDAGIPTSYVQDNHSGSRQGILRGLHYQIRQSQGKLIRVVAGSVYDVAVDLRHSSPTFGRWVGEILSTDNRASLWIPEGFAHGFYVISEWAEIVYKVTDFYAPEWERTLLWSDPELSIPWPLVDDLPPALSVKDAQGKPLKQAETFE